MYQHGFVGVFAFVLVLLLPNYAMADKATELASLDASKPGVLESKLRRLSFDVKRNGKSIGQHVVNIRDDGEQIVVDSEIDVKINIAFVTVFRYNQKGHEVWKDGQLLSLSTLSNDNGNEIKLTAERSSDGLMVHGTRFDGKMAELALPTSYWNEATIACTKMFNTQNGKVMDVNVSKDGADVVQANGRSVEATKYVIGGDLNKQIWYDRAGTWVKSIFNVRGQTIEYVLVDDEMEIAAHDNRIVTR